MKVLGGGACGPRVGDGDGDGASDTSFLCWCYVVGLFCVSFDSLL
jgi:hypothetical protein